MKMKFLLFLLIFPCWVYGAELTLEIADTPDKRTEGLMYRRSLPENHGMYFIYPDSQYVSIWMMNCHIDLSVAFIDKNHVIREIHPLKAHPEWLGRKDAEDLFHQTSVTSQVPVKYVLEVNQGWFEKNNLRVGDKIFNE